MLDKRAQTLLKTLIERYIVEGQPVGSRTLSRHSGLELSPATIRNVMSDLEEMGFIASPHTSAGRVPTALGYRLFVDTLLTVKPLASAEISELQGSIQTHQPQLAINTASQLLSQLTQFAGVVIVPRRPDPVLAESFNELSQVMANYFNRSSYLRYEPDLKDPRYFEKERERVEDGSGRPPGPRP